MSEFLSLKNVTEKDLLLVGEKVVALSKLAKEFPVPQGFVITRELFEDFLKQSGLLAHMGQLFSNLDHTNEKKLQAVATKIQKEIVSTMIPKTLMMGIKDHYLALSIQQRSLRNALKKDDLPFVAVRNAPIGYIDTKKHHLSFLNIQGEERLIKAILTSWASFFTAEAILYRKENQVRHASVALLIQQMLTPSHAGVVYTTNPENHNQMMIQACRGLGSAITMGEVIPDTYLVNKESKTSEKIDVQKQATLFERDFDTNKTGKIHLEEALGAQQKLNSAQIKELAAFANHVEKAFRQPVKFEFALEKDVYYLLQVEPLPGFTPQEIVVEEPALVIAKAPEEQQQEQHQEEQQEEQEQNEDDPVRKEKEAAELKAAEEEPMISIVKEEDIEDQQGEIPLDEESFQRGMENDETITTEESAFPEITPEDGLSMVVQPTENAAHGVNRLLSGMNMALRFNKHADKEQEEMKTTKTKKEKKAKEEAKDDDLDWEAENNTYLDDGEQPEEQEPISEEEAVTQLLHKEAHDDKQKAKSDDAEEQESTTDDGIFFALPQDQTPQKTGEAAATINLADEDDRSINHESESTISNHKMLYHHTKHAASKLIVSCYMAINAALKQKYKEVKGEQPNLTFTELITELQNEVKIPYKEDILKINEMRHAFIEDLQHPTSVEIKNALDVCEAFVKEF